MRSQYAAQVIVISRRQETSYFDIRAEPPIVYLDHCALRRLGQQPAERTRFLAALEAKHGTVALSFMNIIELAGHDDGQTLEQLYVLLAGIGARFVFIRSNPGLDEPSFFKLPPANTIADRDLTAACFEIGMVGPMRADAAVARLLGHRDSYRKLYEELKADTGRRTAALIQWLRAKNLPPLAPTGRFGGEICMQELFAAALKSGATFEENDLADLLHASVPISGTNLVVLDGRWAEFARQVPTPPRVAEVFSVKRKGFSRFLDALDAFSAASEVK